MGLVNRVWIAVVDHMSPSRLGTSPRRSGGWCAALGSVPVVWLRRRPVWCCYAAQLIASEVCPVSCWRSCSALAPARSVPPLKRGANEPPRSSASCRTLSGASDMRAYYCGTWRGRLGSPPRTLGSARSANEIPRVRAVRSQPIDRLASIATRARRLAYERAT